MDKGLKILYQMYWNSGGWTKTEPTAEDFDLAKREGYLFDPAPALTHDQTLQALRDAVSKITPEDVANAFLFSLSTRELKYRSALGSYWYALSLPDHSHTEKSPCYFCDWLPTEDYNVLNFERFKWGGVRHTKPEYALFDLEQFLLLPKVTPTDTDRAILKSILRSIQELAPSKKAGAYRELITRKKLLKSNKSEVEAILNILGICGILSSNDAPCYFDKFVDVYHRSPIENTNDYAYPVNRWHVSDGVNEERFQQVFGVSYSSF